MRTFLVVLVILYDCWGFVDGVTSIHTTGNGVPFVSGRKTVTSNKNGQFPKGYAP